MVFRDEAQARERPYVDICQYDTGSMYDCASACTDLPTHRVAYLAPCYGWSVLDVCAQHIGPTQSRVYPSRATIAEIGPRPPKPRIRYGVFRYQDWQPVKWDYLPLDERMALERTPFGKSCTGCGVRLETEAEFAQHFVISDLCYLNLGTCPDQDTRRPA